jgi:hypothetical protein
VQTDGAVTSVSYGGTGPAVLLLHGFPETNLIWRESPRTLGNNVNRTIGKPCSGNRARIERGEGNRTARVPTTKDNSESPGGRHLGGHDRGGRARSQRMNDLETTSLRLVRRRLVRRRLVLIADMNRDH